MQTDQNQMNRGHNRGQPPGHRTCKRSSEDVQENADLVTFKVTEVLNGKLHFLRSVLCPGRTDQNHQLREF